MQRPSVRCSPDPAPDDLGLAFGPLGKKKLSNILRRDHKAKCHKPIIGKDNTPK
jgi:hypothetical protein